ncbi:hypothetical protein, partial [Lactobacillus crispatus]
MSEHVSHETHSDDSLSSVVKVVDVSHETSTTVDSLDGSPILRQVLGPALPALEMFHMKLMREGEPRGIIGPRDVGIIWERHILNSAAVVP